MLKEFRSDDIYITPFVSTRKWNVSNVGNEDLIILENGNTVALEFVEYGSGESNPTINAECSIAREQQPDDLIRYREGQKRDGIFYPDQEPTNLDGTYKRLVYTQIEETFYNKYRDPTKIWGMNVLDFEKSNTKRYLTEYLKVFDVPQRIFGESIIENTVVLQDNSLDDDYLITDDGDGNLVASSDLFSKKQGVGDFLNIFLPGYSTDCGDYFDFSGPVGSITLSGAQITTGSIGLSWNDPFSDELGWVLQRSINNGENWVTLEYLGINSTGSQDDTVNVGSTYWYRVYAYNEFANSDYSNTYIVTIDYFSPASNLEVSRSITFESQIGSSSLSWSVAGSGVDYVELQRSMDTGSFLILETLPVESASYLDNTITLGHTYYYRLYSVGVIAITSSYSNTVSVIYQGAFDDWAYEASQTSSFDSGSSGWNSLWRVGSLLGHIEDTLSDYTAEQTSSFDGGYGWLYSWTIKMGNELIVDQFDAYAPFQSSSFDNQSFSWNGTWATNWKID
jgi:hypothetical protein